MQMLVLQRRVAELGSLRRAVDRAFKVVSWVIIKIYFQNIYIYAYTITIVSFHTVVKLIVTGIFM